MPACVCDCSLPLLGCMLTLEADISLSALCCWNPQIASGSGHLDGLPGAPRLPFGPLDVSQCVDFWNPAGGGDAVARSPKGLELARVETIWSPRYAFLNKTAGVCPAGDQNWPQWVFWTSMQSLSLQISNVDHSGFTFFLSPTQGQTYCLCSNVKYYSIMVKRAACDLTWMFCIMLHIALQCNWLPWGLVEPLLEKSWGKFFSVWERYQCIFVSGG